MLGRVCLALRLPQRLVSIGTCHVVEKQLRRLVQYVLWRPIHRYSALSPAREGRNQLARLTYLRERYNLSLRHSIYRERLLLHRIHEMSRVCGVRKLGVPFDIS